MGNDTLQHELPAPRWTYLRDAVLRSYSQIFFCRSLLVGLLLLAAGVVSPRLLLAGLASVLLATGLARLLNLSEDLVRSGLFGYNALLVGLGGAALLPVGPGALLLTALAVLASVFVTAALHSALGSTFNLPVLTLPFLLVFPLLMAAATTVGLPVARLAADPVAPFLGLPAPLNLFLQSLGAVFFLPRVDAGLLVLLALVAYSRVGVVLAMMGFGISQLLGMTLAGPATETLPVVLGYNFMLTAVALGGVWFVPSVSSLLFAAAGVLVGALITLGLMPLLSWNGLSPLILPFNVTVLMLLYAMRQRVLDRRPKAVDFLLGTPEENLNYFRTRLSRFGARYFIRFSAPFLGRWTCTQGVDGDRTHRGPWRHAFDFEVAGPDGEMFRDHGRDASDYHCYKLPVLAAAEGTVARVVDGVADNPVGQVNLRDNWGNLVLLYHAPGLYSLVCHLAPGSITVQEGQLVRRGETLGLCGNSGRSPVPHIHWQLQATARVGAPTLQVELHDVVRQELQGRQQLHGTLVPEPGDLVRNLEPADEAAGLLQFTYGEPLSFAVNGVQKKRTETVVPDIDLFGALLLRSSGRSQAASLYYDAQPSHFSVFDTIGRRGSVLQMIHAALSRVPLEFNPDLVWSDVLPLRHFLPWWVRLLLDLAAPFLRNTGIRVDYRAMREGSLLIVQGRSRRLRSDGTPLLQTHAELDPQCGIRSLRLTVRGKTRTAERLETPQQPQTRDARIASNFNPIKQELS